MADGRTPRERRRDARAALARIRRGEAPTAEELAAAPRLDFWSVVAVGPSFALVGVVTGHPDLRQGAKVLTSDLLWLSEDRTAARTVSRFYRLGVPMDATPSTMT